ncbi:pilin N-terminal domain-containing protein [Finegoldia magna]|uniref:pilin N-terminal domain-containing protein n=1 Tax=Finegoldia magna TaxID=1260 RepID=UPI00399C3855
MKKRFLSLIIALAMMVGVFTPLIASAEGEHKTDVVIHKTELKDLTGWPKGEGKKGDIYDGSELTKGTEEAKGAFEKYFGDGAKELAGVKFYVYAVSETDYKTMIDKPTDYKTKEDVTTKIKNATLVKNGEKDYFVTTTNGVTIPNLVDGHYWFVEDEAGFTDDNGRTITGAKAVPFGLKLPVYKKDGSMFGTGKKDALHVYPKNTLVEKPEIDKNFAANNDLGTVEDKNNNQKSGADYDNYQKEKATATADLGKSVPYEVKTKIKKGSKYKKLVWNDNMTKGLTYQKDLKVEGAGLAKDKDNNDYFVTETDRGFTLVLTESGLTKVENAAKTADVEIKLTYSAKINGQAVVDKPELNDIALDYSNKPGKDSEPKEFTPGRKEISMDKTWDKTGSKEITEADKGVTAYFTLQKKNDQGKWEDVETVEKTEKENFEVKFSNLDENGTYRIVESVKGYEAEYMQYNPETGKIEIKDHKDTDNPERLNPTEPKVQLGGRKFVKTNNEDKGSAKLERLAGAEFYVKNAEGKYLVAAKKDAAAVTAAKEALDAAVEAYNNLTAEEQKGEKGTAAKKTINDKQDAYNKAFKENASAYSWTTLEDYNKSLKEADPNAKEITDVKDIKNIVVLTSDAEGRFEISGLEYKAGYKLEEKTAPKGFAKLQSPEEFEVKNGSYASTDAELQYNKDNADNGYGLQIKNKNVTIPQTGGIGTVIFTAIGLAIMASAIIAIKKRQATEAR